MLRMDTIKMGLIGGAALLVAPACGGGADDASGGAQSAGGEEQYAGPITSTDLELGASRYQTACASCHENGAPQLANIGWSAGRMRQQVREGSSQMPALGPDRVSDAELEAILAHLQTMGAVTE